MATNQTTFERDPDMIIRSNRPPDHFTVISNQVINNHNLTYRARGILIYLLSKPDGWYTSAERLSSMHTEGRDAIRTCLKELQEAGYMQLFKRQDDLGLWESHWLVFDKPVHNAVDKIEQMRKTAKTPKPEKPKSENQALYKQLITKDLISGGQSLCGQCQGEGVELRDDEINVCPECKGDGIARG
jgi:hypothetical protein